MPHISFYNADGDVVVASAANPLPVTGAGGGGMTPEDITASAPLSWDAGTATMSADLSGYATSSELSSGLAGKSDTGHTHTQGQVNGLTAALSDLDRVAAHVGNADGTDTTTLAAAVDAIRDALVAAGLMASA